MAPWTRLRLAWFRRRHPEVFARVRAATVSTVAVALAEGRVEVHPDDVDKPFDQRRFRFVDDSEGR